MSKLSKIPPNTLSKLSKLGIQHRSQLLLHLPLRYEDETHLTPLATIQAGQTVQVQGIVTHHEIIRQPRKALICRINEGHEELYLRFINFYPYTVKQLALGATVRAIGEVRMGFYGLEMVHPRCRNVDEQTPLNPCLTPIYPTTAGLSQTTLRKLIQNALEQIPLTDTLPEALRTAFKLIPLADSLNILHNPPPDSALVSLETRRHPAWQRIKFDELLAQQLSMRLHYQKRRQRHAPPLPKQQILTQQLLAQLPFQLTDAQQLLAQLPFQLTDAQQRVTTEITADLTQTQPMQRLLLGDVGSGKTIVATLAALQAIENGYQVALMAPTEILAEQHFIKLSDWLSALDIKPVWLSGSLKKKQKNEAIQAIAEGLTPLAIGTHALFQESVQFNKLGLVIIDEQHKFGVQQRLALFKKGDSELEPHQLMMSATPIPRTLAMSYYADLDVSMIDQLPPGRTPVVTKLINSNRREQILQRVRAACAKGEQAYWVCPLIDESETLQLQTAIETHELLSAALPELVVGLAHGKQANEEKAAVMAAFKANEVQLLVATTVIEVGVDVPNASLMVIEHAERMGLAQLHQLRGRVGRGIAQSMCILMFQDPLSQLARARLKIIYENNDGFKIAEQDLQLRGPGELLGARQSGVAMLRFADLNEDEDLLALAQQAADQLLRHNPLNAQQHLRRWMTQNHDYLFV